MIRDTLLNIDQILPILQKVTIFSGFTEMQIRDICNKCSIIDAESDDVILEEKMPATEIFVLLIGKVSIVLNLKEDPLEVIEFGPGNCIGEASVIGIQEHSASAVVIENATLLVLSRQVLMGLFENDKGLFALLILNIARELARRLHRTDQVLFHYGKIEKLKQPLFNCFNEQAGT
jgi:CRP-like cAMP-binding protein